MFRSIILFLLVYTSIQSQESNHVFLNRFQPFEILSSPEIEEKIQQIIQVKLQSRGFILVKNKTQASFILEGYYTRTKNGNLNIYAQIYDPITNTLIDSVKATDVIDEESLGIKLDSNEMKVQDQERIETIADRVVTAVRSNPNKKVRHERIEENLLDTKIIKAKDFKIQKLDEKQVTEDVFKIIGEENVITATKRSQSLREVPGTVYVITEEDIRRYGYRDLQEILQRIPSMEMLREGAETKGGVRGFLGSAKPLMMINGREVVQHKPLSPYISHQFRANMIKRVEIVQGPASALYGANAFSGIINIITKDTKVTKDVGYIYGMGGDFRTYEGGASVEKKISENASLTASGYSFYTRGEDFSNFWSPYNPKNWIFLGWYPREDINKGLAPYPVVSTGAPALGGLTPSYETNVAQRFSELYPTRDPRSFFPFINPSRATGGNMEFQHKYFYIGLDYFIVQTGTYYPIKKTNHSNDHIERQLMTGFFGIRELPLFLGFNFSMDIMIQREDLKQQIQYGYSILEFDNDGNLITQNTNPFAQGIFANEGNMRYKGFIQFDKDFSNIGNYLIFGFGYDRYNTATSVANYLPGFVGTFATFLPRGNPAPWEPDERPFYKQNKISFYIQDQQNLYRHSLQLTLGARFDKHNIYGTVFNPRIGLVYTPEFIKRNTFKFLYGTAFREPSVFEYSTNVDFFVSRMIQSVDTGFSPLDTYIIEQIRKNNTTEPETVRTFEFSWITTPYNWITHTLSLYRNWGENIIVPKPSPDGVTLSFGNEGNRRVDGLESYLRLRYREIGIFTSYSQYLKTEGTGNHKYIQSENYAYIRGFEYAYPLKISDRHMNIYPRQFSVGVDIKIPIFGIFSPTLSLEHLWKDAMYTIGQDENGEPIKVKSPIFRQNNITLSILNLDSFGDGVYYDISFTVRNVNNYHNVYTSIFNNGGDLFHVPSEGRTAYLQGRARF